MGPRWLSRRPWSLRLLAASPSASSNLSPPGCGLLASIQHIDFLPSYNNSCVSASYVLMFSKKSSLINPTYLIITPLRINRLCLLKYLKVFSCRDCSAPQRHKSPVFLQMPSLWHSAHSGYSGNMAWLTK